MGIKYANRQKNGKIFERGAAPYASREERLAGSSDNSPLILELGSGRLPSAPCPARSSTDFGGLTAA